MADAVPLQLRRVKTLERQLGPSHSDTLEATLLLSNCVMRAELDAVALPLFLQVLDLTERLLGLFHPAPVTLRDLRPLSALGTAASSSQQLKAIAHLH